MLEYKTVKYHIPQQGIYLYARTNEGKTEMIVLNSTDQEQTLPSEHYNALTNGRKTGTEIASGKQVDFTRNYGGQNEMYHNGMKWNGCNSLIGKRLRQK